MGFDCGFDIHPRLEATVQNIASYQQFLDEIMYKYDNIYDEKGRRADGKVLQTPKDSNHSDEVFTYFMVGECPHLPSNAGRCDYFLRFSSKISSHLTAPAKPYIMSVLSIAKKYFGDRVHFWHEMSETDDERQHGCYDWTEVHDASQQLRALETGVTKPTSPKAKALSLERSSTPGPS